jgi:hypothetical protein
MMQGIPPLSTYSSIQKIKIIILINRINTLIKNPWAEAIPSKKKKSFTVIYSKMNLFCYAVEY